MKIEKFRGNLISRTAKNLKFRRNLISRMTQKKARNPRNLVPAKFSDIKALFTYIGIYLHRYKNNKNWTLYVCFCDLANCFIDLYYRKERKEYS